LAKFLHISANKVKNIKISMKKQRIAKNSQSGQEIDKKNMNSLLFLIIVDLLHRTLPRTPQFLCVYMYIDNNLE